MREKNAQAFASEWPDSRVRSLDWKAPDEFFDWIGDPDNETRGPFSETIRVLNRDIPFSDRAFWDGLDSHPPLVVETLHYHRWLYEWTRSDSTSKGTRDIVRKIFQDWGSAQPCGLGRAWDPFTVAYRSQVWLRMALLEEGQELFPNLPEALFLHGLYLERNLEFHLGGNHLWKDLSALLMLSAYFEGPTADRWFESASGLLEREIEKQILRDGGHYERSPMYHLLVLGDLLDVRDMLRPVQSEWTRTRVEPVIDRMAAFLARVLHPDGEVPFFNDTVFGQAPPPVLALVRAGLERSQPKRLDVCQQTGVARLTNENLTLIFDGGPLGPDELMGHVHNDTLSIEISVGAHRMIVNRGVYEYTRGVRREDCRSIHSHNTPCLDGLEQSEIWSSFRVGNRWHPKRFDVSGEEFSSIWSRPGMPNIKRSIQPLEQGFEIRDEFVGSGNHRLTSPFHFAPKVALSEGTVERSEGRTKARWTATQEDARLKLEFDLPDSVEVRVEECAWWPKFYVEEPMRKLVLVGDIECDAFVKTTVLPHA